jgi:hypothetical protein
MDNAKTLERAGFRKTDFSEWMINKARAKAFHLEIVRDAPTEIINKCLNESVRAGQFHFYYWANPPQSGTCGKLLGELKMDKRIRPVTARVYGNPVYQTRT